MFWYYYLLAGFLFLVVFVEDITRIMECAGKEDGEIAMAMHFADKYGDNQFAQLFIVFFTMFFILHMIVASIAFKAFRKR